MWIALASGVMIAGLAIWAAWKFVDPCPRCGSRLKATYAYDDDGKMVSPTCLKCGYQWVPEWMKRARKREDR